MVVCADSVRLGYMQFFAIANNVLMNILECVPLWTLKCFPRMAMRELLGHRG